MSSWIRDAQRRRHVSIALTLYFRHLSSSRIGHCSPEHAALGHLIVLLCWIGAFLWSVKAHQRRDIRTSEHANATLHFVLDEQAWNAALYLISAPCSTASGNRSQIKPSRDPVCKIASRYQRRGCGQIGSKSQPSSIDMLLIQSRCALEHTQ